MFIQAWLLWMAESHSQTETPKGQIQTIVAQLQHGYSPGSKVTLISTLSDLWKFHMEPELIMVLTRRFLSNIGFAVTSRWYSLVALRSHPCSRRRTWRLRRRCGILAQQKTCFQLYLPGSNRTFCHLQVPHLEQMLFFFHWILICSYMFNNGFFSCGNSAEVRGFPTISHWFLWYAKTVCF